MPLRITLPLVLVAGFAAVGVVGGRREVAGDPGVVRVVSSLPRTGSARGETDAIVNGIRLALEQDGGTVTTADPDTGERRTFRIDYLDLDDATAAAGQWTIEQEIANANQAEADPDVMVYVGTYNSGAARASMPILNRARMLYVSPANTSPSLTKPRSGDRHEPDCFRPSGEVNFVRVVPADDLQGAVAAHWAKDLGAKAVYVLDDTDVYGKGIADLFHRTCERIGVGVLGHESIDPKAQEFTALMAKVKARNPDLVYFGGMVQTKAGQLLKDLIKAGLTCPMMAPDGCYQPAMIASAGPEAFEKVKFYVTFGGIPPERLTGAGAEFVRRYTERYNRPPRESYAAYGYDAGLVAREAIRRAGKKDRDAVRRAGLAVELVGATGRIAFTPDGDTRSQTMSGNTVENGEFQFVRLLTLKDDSPK